MNKKIIVQLLIGLVLWNSYGCTKKTSVPIPAENQIRVGMVIDILGTQEPIFTKPVVSLLQEMEKTGKIVLSLQTCSHKAEYEKNLILLSETNHLIIVGPLFAKEVAKIAPLYPYKHFISLDFPVKGPNITSLLFREEDMALRGLTLCRNQSKTKKIGAIFQGDPGSSFSVVLTDTIPEARTLFIPFGSSSSRMLEAIKEISLPPIDFVYIGQASYLEEMITIFFKNNQSNLGIVCPKLIISEKITPIFATIEKNYTPSLTKLIDEYRAKKQLPSLLFVSDFSSVLVH
jgi:hypothetical protein